MIKFLVVDRYERAVEWGRFKAAHRLGMNRYATRESDDVRVVVRVSEVFRSGGVIELIRGPGFEDALTAPDRDGLVEGELDNGRIARERAEEFEALVSSGGARWVE